MRGFAVAVLHLMVQDYGWMKVLDALIDKIEEHNDVLGPMLRDTLNSYLTGGRG